MRDDVAKFAELTRIMRFFPLRLIPMLGIAALLVISGCGQNLTRTSGKLPRIEGGASAYRLGSGDKLRITVYNEPALSGEYEVDGAGALSLNLIGSVAAKNLPLERLVEIIEGKLRDGFLKEPRVSIDVLNCRPFYVLDEVKEPGKYAYVNGMTVLNAVALAGGYTYRARENQVVVIRGDNDGRREWEADEQAIILPGDIIRVPERFF